MAEVYSFELRIHGPARSWTVEVPEGRLRIGRLPANDLVLDEQVVSSKHAVLERSGASCTITDTGSSNGTRVNGESLQPNVPYPLQDGDEIVIPGLDKVGAIAVPSFRLVFVQQPLAAEEPEPAKESAHSEPTVAETAASPTPEPPPIPEQAAQAPPPPPAPPAPVARQPADSDAYEPPPGLSLTQSSYMQYLPDIYDTSFMHRFLALLESIYAPITWTIENFDLFLHPCTAPADFLPWLANWFDLTFDPSWSETQRRVLLAELHEIHAYRGTRWALERILHIYTGSRPDIDDTSETLPPFTFSVTLNALNGVSRHVVEQLIDQHKPAHTSYVLHIN